jgi:hypothetical protein
MFSTMHSKIHFQRSFVADSKLPPQSCEDETARRNDEHGVLIAVLIACESYRGGSTA